MSARAIHRLTAVGVLFAILFAARPADAKGFVLITHGDDIAHVVDASPEAQAQLHDLGLGYGAAVGYKYSSVGVFFLDLWRWSGEFVLYSGDTYVSATDLGLTEAELAEIAGVSPDALDKPFTYTFPPGLIIVILLGLGGIAYYVWRSRRRARVMALFGDDRYRHAVNMLAPSDDEDDDTPAASFDDAVEFLVDRDVPRAEARTNLESLLRELTDDAHGQAY